MKSVLLFLYVSKKIEPAIIVTPTNNVMTVVSNNGEDSLNLRTEFSIIKYGVEHTVRKLPKFDTALGLSFSSKRCVPKTRVNKSIEKAR